MQAGGATRSLSLSLVPVARSVPLVAQYRYVQYGCNTDEDAAHCCQAPSHLTPLRRMATTSLEQSPAEQHTTTLLVRRTRAQLQHCCRYVDSSKRERKKDDIPLCTPHGLTTSSWNAQQVASRTHHPSSFATDMHTALQSKHPRSIDDMGVHSKIGNQRPHLVYWFQVRCAPSRPSRRRCCCHSPRSSYSRAGKHPRGHSVGLWHTCYALRVIVCWFVLPLGETETLRRIIGISA